ncbi:hypothetical protein [Falsihalocynthiibacter sp. CO-5D18]|uniref:hypothetical protein n=1 Tax=Falsihalocynthiibacter sp. CO-5D18 TaxID=3240872 RepID=UPI00350F934A
MGKTIITLIIGFAMNDSVDIPEDTLKSPLSFKTDSQAAFQADRIGNITIADSFIASLHVKEAPWKTADGVADPRIKSY